MKLMALDLEMNQPSRKIIQIGAAVCDLDNKKIIDKKCWNILIDEQVTEYITNLTRITQSDVDGGISLTEGYSELKKFHEQYLCWINPCTWGGNDAQELRDQLNISDDEWCLGRRVIDVKTIYVFDRLCKGEKPVGGLSKSMAKFKMKFEGRKHNAADDAENTLRFMFRLMEEYNRGDAELVKIFS